MTTGTLGLILLIGYCILPFVASAGPGELPNPLSLDSVDALLLAIVNIFQIVLVPIVVFFIIYGGFLYVTAQGNGEKLDAAKRAIIYAIIGGVIIVGAEAIGLIVQNTATQFNP